MFQKPLKMKRRCLHTCSQRACWSIQVHIFECVCACVFWAADSSDWYVFSLCSCWMSVETHLLFAVHGPILAALLVSLLIHCFSTLKETYMITKWEILLLVCYFSRSLSPSNIKNKKISSFLNFLQVNLFFLLNIIRVLVTKLRDTHRAESNMYMKAVRATLILVPLLGIQFVIFPWRPENRLAGEVYEYVMHILMHYQVGTELTPRHCINQNFHSSTR